MRKSKPWHWIVLGAIAVVWAVFGLWWLLGIWLGLWLVSLAITASRRRHFG